MLIQSKTNERMKVMKRFFKETGKALGYFLIYLVAQVIAGIMISWGVQFKLGYEAGASGAEFDPVEVSKQASEIAMHNLGLMLIISAVFTIFTYVVIAKSNHHKFTEEASLNKISFKTVVLSLMTAVGCTCFFTYGMDFLPIPEDLVEGMVNGNQQLADIPLWQSIAATAIIVPILEEIVFRGFVFSRLDRVMNTWVAIIITSIIFGLCHGQLLWAAWAAVMGFVFNIVRVKTKSIIPGIVMHIANNSYSTIMHATDSTLPENMKLPVVIIGAILLAVSLFIFFKNAENKDDSDVKVEVITA